MRTKDFLRKAAIGVTHQTPAYRAKYCPAPTSLLGQVWAGMTRNTPAFTGATVPGAGIGQKRLGQEQEQASARTALRVALRQAAPALGMIAASLLAIGLVAAVVVWLTSKLHGSVSTAHGWLP